MARPTKEGLDYFPHDTDAVNDEKIEALRLVFGNDGYAFYFIMLERIYRTSDGELNVSDAETITVLRKKIRISKKKFEEILSYSLKINCFSGEIYSKSKKISSEGIKKRMKPVIDKRLKMKEKYEISDAETKQKRLKKRLPNDDKGEERKGKERKVKNKEPWKLPVGIDKNIWEEFEKHRKDIKKSLTDEARTKNANILIGKSKEEQQTIVDKTIANHWTGLFEDNKNKPQSEITGMDGLKAFSDDGNIE